MNFTGRDLAWAGLGAILAAVIALGSRDTHANPPPPSYPSGGVAYPAYGPGYGEPSAWTKADVRKHLALLESIDRRAGGGEKRAGPDLAAVVVAACAKCHNEQKKKGDLILVLGEPGNYRLKPLSVRELKSINKEVLDGTMPPEGEPPLGAAEKSAFKEP